MSVSRRGALAFFGAVPILGAVLADPARAAAEPSGSPSPTGGTADGAPGDVAAVQRWLNATFGQLQGWQHVDEDGVAGAGTRTGVLQGAQSLLGITPLVPAYGPETRQRLRDHGPVRLDGDQDAAAWCSLVQAGLICAGGAGARVTGDWDDASRRALDAYRADLGAPTADPTRGAEVSPALFAALFTVGAATLVPGGSTEVRAVQQYLNRTAAEVPGGAYCGTGGVADVPTGGAVVRALQSAIGVQDVDGVWGPATAAALRAATQATVRPGDTGSWAQLAAGLLVLNGVHVPFDAAWSAVDVESMRQFQAFQAFEPAAQTGVCDPASWAALAVSCGDADRPVTGADTATRLTADQAAAIRASGVSLVGRYLTDEQVPGALDKALTPSELDVLASACLRLWPIFEEGGYEASWFSRDQGVRDAERAHDAARALGIPKQTTISFAVDYDDTADDVADRVLPYFRGVAAGLRARGDEYHPGVYGSRRTCAAVAHAGLAHHSFVAGMSTGWEGNVLRPLPDDWAFNQIQTRTVGQGAGRVEIDAVVVSGRDLGVQLH